MDNQDIDILLKNQSLKVEFALRNLDLNEVFWYTPDDLGRENRELMKRQYLSQKQKMW